MWNCRRDPNKQFGPRIGGSLMTHWWEIDDRDGGNLGRKLLMNRLLRKTHHLPCKISSNSQAITLAESQDFPCTFYQNPWEKARERERKFVFFLELSALCSLIGMNGKAFTNSGLVLAVDWDWSNGQDCSTLVTLKFSLSEAMASRTVPLLNFPFLVKNGQREDSGFRQPQRITLTRLVKLLQLAHVASSHWNILGSIRTSCFVLGYVSSFASKFKITIQLDYANWQRQK